MFKQLIFYAYSYIVLTPFYRGQIAIYGIFSSQIKTTLISKQPSHFITLETRGFPSPDQSGFGFVLMFLS